MTPSFPLHNASSRLSSGAVDMNSQRLGYLPSPGVVPMRRLCVVVAVFSVVSCGGGGNKNCDFSQAVGTYRTTVISKSGNCGDIPLPEEFQSNGEKPIEQQADDGCVTTTSQIDEASCTNDFNLICTTGPDSTTEQVFHLEYSPDGSHVKGTITITMTGPSGSCTNRYEVSFVRL